MKKTLSASAPADAICLDAKYIGPAVKYNTKIPKNAILVKTMYKDGSIMKITNWEYIRTDIVTEENKGLLLIQYGSCVAQVKIKLYKKHVVSFECHYHGDPVLINTEFDKKKLHARILYDDGEWKDLYSYEYNLPEDTIVKEVGNNNFYTATYQTFEDKFVVYGYSESEADKDFQIFQRNGNIETDVTDAYYPLFYNEILGKIHVTISKLNSELTAGVYRIILPKNTGLNCKHASEWMIKKNLNNDIIITPIKFYHEEDINNG